MWDRLAINIFSFYVIHKLNEQIIEEETQSCCDMWQSIFTNKQTVLLQCLGKVMFYLKCLFPVWLLNKQCCVFFILYMTKIDLFSLCIFILFVLFKIPGCCVFYNSWKKFFFLHSWSNNQLSCGILEIFTMRANDYGQIINYDWP